MGFEIGPADNYLQTSPACGRQACPKELVYRTNYL